MTPSERRSLPWIAKTLLLASGLLIALVIGAYLSFGSIAASLAYARGDRLIVDATNKSFGTLRSNSDGTLVFQIRNLASRPITVLGARSSCTCTAVENLPLTIQPRETHPLKIRIRPGKKTGDIDEKVSLFSDFSIQTELILKVVGKIVKDDGSRSAITMRTGD